MASRIAQELWAAGRLARSGMLGLLGPGQLVAIATAYRSYGALGATVRVAAIRHPRRTAVVDERGAVTFGELDASSNAIANQWRRRGLRAGDGVAVLARNHRGFLEAVFAAAKCGARIILLDTDFGQAQLLDVVRREGADLVVYDDEFAAAVAGLNVRHGTWMAWTDSGSETSLGAAIVNGDPSPPPASGANPRSSS